MAQAEQVTKHCGNQCDAAMILPGKDKIRPPSSSFNHIFIIPQGLLLLLFSKIHIHYVCIIDFSKVKKMYVQISLLKISIVELKRAKKEFYLLF